MGSGFGGDVLIFLFILSPILWVNSENLTSPTVPSEYTGKLPSMGPQKALYRYLMNDYEKHSRPIKDPNSTLILTIGVKLNQLLDLNERTQVLTTIVALDQMWTDEYLVWDPNDFAGIKSTYFPCDKVWLPDVVVYNSVEGISNTPYLQSPATVDHTGKVSWFPLTKLQTSCKLDIRFYPFDDQACYLKIGSWSHSARDIDVIDGFTGIEKPDYVDNGEFELLEFKVKRVENIYDCCPYPIITLSVYIHFRRRPMFSMFTIAIPCIMLSLMTTIAFILPPQNEAKVEVQLSVMLSLAVFMLMIGESLPPTSDTIPLLGVHIVIQMGLTALSLICSVFVLRLVHTDHKDVPEVLRKRAVKIATILYVGVPDYLKDIHSYRDKLAYIEKHQLKIRMDHITCNGKANQSNNDMHKDSAEDISETKNLMDTSFELGEPSSATHSDDKSHHKKNKMRKVEMILSKVLEHLEDNALKEQRRAEWRLLGSVIDRILLIILVLAATLTTAYIYAIAPFVQTNF